MRKHKVVFCEKNLTGNAGLTHVARFAKKLGLPQMLEHQIGIVRANNARYSAGLAVMMLLMGVLVGAKHFSHLVILREDSVIRKLFRWTLFPVDTSIRRILKLFTHEHCNELSNVEDMVRRKVWSKKFFGKITMDMDSTVIGVFGSQEGAAKGYNPKKKGQKSYHPLLCFIAETRECLHNWFRTGSAYSSNGCVEFVKECLTRIPKRVWRIDFRGDSAFFIGQLLDLLEIRGVLYTIKVKMKGLVSLLEAQKWRKVKNRPGIESTEFTYKCGGWLKKRRFTAIRIVTYKKSDDLLFPEDKPEYEYFCYVTTMRRSPWGTHKYYGKRATSENWIEWCKNQMASGSILVQEFWANSAIFQTCILAYNLLVWMMWLTNPEGFREEPNTIRMFLIHVPGRLVSSGRQLFLRLSRHYPFKSRWRSIEMNIAQLEFQ